MTYCTKSENETLELGKEFGKRARAGEVYALYGDLGAGKSVFARGFALGLGIEERVTSPTFTIMQAYDSGRLPLYHFDVYRLAGEAVKVAYAMDGNIVPGEEKNFGDEDSLECGEEKSCATEDVDSAAADALIDLGYEEYFYGDGVCLIEWAGLIKELLPENTVYVSIKREKKESNGSDIAMPGDAAVRDGAEDTRVIEVTSV